LMKSNKQLLFQYAGFAFQLLVLLIVAVFAGLKFDEWLNLTIPVFVWLLPLLAIIGTIFKTFNDTKRKN
ncbi:MAG: hypothetical protein ACOVNR_04445, partial [Chitinophagaceae bacterium]